MNAKEALKKVGKSFEEWYKKEKKKVSQV